MSHTATCTWDGKHASHRGYRLAYFTGLLAALERLDAAAAEDCLAEAGLRADQLDPLDEVTLQTAERILLTAARRLGGIEELASLKLGPEDCFFERAVQTATPGYGGVEAFVRCARLAQFEGSWNLRMDRNKGLASLRYSGSAHDEGGVHAAYRMALVRCAAEMVGGSLRRRIRVTGGDLDGNGRQRFTLSGLGERPVAPLSLGLALAAAALAAAAWGGVLGWLLLGAAVGLALISGIEWRSLLASKSPRDAAPLRVRDQAGAIAALHFDVNGRCLAYFGADGLVRYVNRAMAMFLGLAPVSDEAELTRQIERKVGTGPWQGPREVRTADGSARTVQLAELPVLDRPGRPLGSVLELSDVEDDWRGGTVSVAKAALFESLIDNGLQAVLVLSNERKITFASRNFDRLFGYPAAELLDQDILTLFTPEDRDSAAWAVRNSVAGFTARLRMLIGGQPRWIQARFEDRRDDAIIGGILVQLRDVTAEQERETALRETQDSLRLNEQYFRMMIEGSQDLISVLDARGRVVFVNGAVDELLGHRPGGLVGRDGLRLVAETDRAAITAAAAKVQSDSGWGQAQVRLRHVNGESRLFSLRARKAVDPDGREVYLVGGRDVTNEARLQAALLREGRLEAVGQLAGGLAHDFNNLLTVILGNTELSLLEGVDAAQRARVEETHLATLKASELVRHLLAFGRAKPHEPEVMDLAETLRVAARLMRGVLGPEIRLRLDAGEGPAWIVAEEAELERAFLNLASNARDAMPEGGLFDIQLNRLERPGAAGPWAEVVLTDTGIGMDETVKSRIFEPYFTTHGAGNGLGLTQVYGVVRQAGGEVEVESSPGAGSQFRLRFPLAAQSGRAPAASATPSAPKSAPQRQRSVLVVDDDPAVRRFASEALAHLGYEVLEACHGEDAIAIWRESRYYRRMPDLILSDVVMPRMSGFQLADAIAAEDPRQRVALMSGYYDDEKVHLGSLRWPVLKKPFNLEALKEFVDSALARELPAP